MSQTPSGAPGPNTGLAKRVAVGGASMVLARFVIRAIGLGSTIILARILVPEDFGLVALATSIVGVLEVISEFSFDAALIRDQKAEKADYDAAWTLTILRQFLIAALLAASAGTVAEFFADGRLENILYLLAAATALEGFANIGVVDLVKHFQFGRQFWYLVVPKLVGVLVTIALALSWRSYWVLIAGILSAKASKIVLSYAFHRYRPALSLRRAPELIHFSKWLLLNNVCIFANFQIDTFIIGRMFGAQALGLFNVAKEVALLPTTELVWPLSQAIFPGLSKIGNDRPQLTKAYLDSLGIMWLLGAPAGLGIAVTADLAVMILLGDKWLDAIPLMQVLAVSGAFRILYAMSGPVYLVVGKPYLIAGLACATFLISVVTLYFGLSYFGLIGASYAILVSTLASLCINGAITLAILRVSLRSVLAQIWRPFIATAVMVTGVYALRQAWIPTETLGGHASLLLICMLIGSLIYMTTVVIFWLLSRKPEGAETRILNLLNQQYRANSFRK